jgi:EmrB/QacA subfamily drug resistance transporter
MKATSARPPHPWLIFALVAVAQFMVVLDVSITNVALPSIKSALHFASDSSLQWVITAYALTFGGFLLLGGRAADLFGRRRMLLWGMGAFTCISLLIGFSHSALMLIALRALQGIAAAVMSPSALSIVLSTFGEGSDRDSALGWWSTIATGGAAVGLLLGGVLTQYLGWEWNFFINVPVGAVMLALISGIVPVHEHEVREPHLDTPGAALSTLGLMAFVLAVSDAPQAGWLSAQTIGVGLVAFALIAAFVWNESRSAHPLMPLSIFKTGNVAAANLIMAPIYACVLGMFFLASLYLQNVLDFAPAITGLAFLPFPLIVGIVSSRVPALVGRYGYKGFLIIGPLLVAAGLAWLSRAPVNGSYLIDVLPTLIIMPIGMGCTFMPIIAAATAGIPADETGLASGLVTTSQQAGGALGLAILSGVATTAGVGGKDALVHGFDSAFGVAVVFALIASGLAALSIKNLRSKARAVALH